MNEMYPFLTERHLSRRLWGGERLTRYLGLDAEVVGDPVGEAWQVYGQNRIINGGQAGRTLQEVAAEAGEELLGSVSVGRYGTKVPLLAKFLDAAEPLSIQVHPDDDYALEQERDSGHLGKAEAWYILECSAGAHIVWGFGESHDKATIRRAVETGELEELVNRVPVKAGDVIYNPPGTVHAVGGGIFLFEIQQASDLTYRLYDYGRRGSDGQLRELHLDRALAVADLAPGLTPMVTPRSLGRGRRLLVECPHFVMEAITPDGGTELATAPTSLEAITVARGEMTLFWSHGTLSLPQGTSALLPAALGAYLLEGEGELLRCYLPAS